MFERILDLLRKRPVPSITTVGDPLDVLASAKGLSPSKTLILLCQLLWDKDSEVWQEAERLFEEALNAIVDLDISSLSMSFDLGTSGNAGHSHAFSAAQLKAYPIDQRRNLYRVTSRFPSGYVREAALRQLGLAPISNDWPFIIDRLGDWVPPIAKLATNIVSVGLREGKVCEIIRWQKAMANLCRRTRTQESRILREIVFQADKEGCLKSNWKHSNHVFRQRAAELLLERTDSFPENYPSLAVEPSLGVISLVAKRFHAYSPDQIQALCNELSQNPNPAARRFGLEAVVNHAVGDVNAALQTGLLDRSVRVRSFAQYASEKRGLPVRGIYLDHLKDSPTPGAIEGLLEIGGVRDAPVVHRYLTSDKTSVRLAAYRGLLRLEIAGNIREALRDPSGKVRKIAVAYVRGHYEAFDADSRLELFESDNPDHSAAGAFLLMCLSRWRALPWILRFVHHEDARIASKAHLLLGQWLVWAGSSPTLPTVEHYHEARRLLDSARPALSKQNLQALESFLAWTSNRLGLS